MLLCVSVATERIPWYGEQDTVYGPINQTEPLSGSFICVYVCDSLCSTVNYFPSNINLYRQDFSRQHGQKNSSRRSRSGKTWTWPKNVALSASKSFSSYPIFMHNQACVWYLILRLRQSCGDFSSMRSWTLVNHSFKRLLIIDWNPNLSKLPACVSANNYSSKLNHIVNDGWIFGKTSKKCI